MSHPDEEVLAAIALGDGAEVSGEHVRHSRSCLECAALVGSVRETAALLRKGASAAPLMRPPTDLFSRIEAAIGAHDPALAASTTGGPEVLHASVRPPADAAAARERRDTRRLRVGWASGLAAAGMAVGLLTGRALWQDQTPQAPAVSMMASTQLDTLDTGRRLGDATLVRTPVGVDLRVATSPLDPGAGYLEVWLINTDGKRMVSIGVLRGGGAETFPISQALIDHGYVVVDISREGFDDKPQHSGDSLARGTLSA
jgi:hypothetical protein